MGRGAELNCGQSCLKYLLIAFNTIFFLCGACLLGVGLWVRFDPKLKYVHEVATIDDTNVGTAATYFVIALGCFIFLFGMVGCCGACNESKCLLGLYAGLVGLIMLLQIAAAATAAVYRNKIDKEIKDEMYRQVRNDYRLDVTSESTKKFAAITLAWNEVQLEFECCGANHPSDWHNEDVGTDKTVSEWKNEVNKIDPKPINATDINYPYTCCKTENKVKDWKDNANYINEEDYRNCQIKNAAVGESTKRYAKGCYETLKQALDDSLVIIIAVCCGILLLELFALISAVCVMRGI